MGNELVNSRKKSKRIGVFFQKGAGLFFTDYT